MEYILIFISAIFVNNIVLSQFLGICPFLGVSKKVETAMGMSAAVAFVLTIATIVTFLIQKFVLDAFGLGYLQTITFILVIAGLVQMVEIILKKVCVLHCYRLRSGAGTVCRITRADESCEGTERDARHSDCFDYRRFAGYGIHGFLRRRVKD